MWQLDYKNAKLQRTDAFELWCWRRLLRVPWTARRPNQSILKEISLEYSLVGLMLNSNTLATWWEELTHLERPWCWESLQAEKGTTEDEMVGWYHWLARHEFQEALGVCSNSCPLGQWCHPTISSSVISFSCLQSFLASESFPMSQLVASVLEIQLQHQSFQWIFRVDFL